MPQNATEKQIKLLYIIGTYPEISTTFIDREISILRQQPNIKLDTISIRHPVTIAATMPEYKEARDSTLYLTPLNWLTMIFANLFFIFSRPIPYISTKLYLFTRPHDSLKLRFMTLIHFYIGVYAAFQVRQRDFDHIHVHFIDRSVTVALVMGRLLSKSYSLTAHANSIFVKKVLISEKIENAKFMVTVSKHNKAHLVENYPRIKGEKIHIFHPWVDVSRFVPPESRPINEKLQIFSVGRLVEKKGHKYLIEACHFLQEAGIDFECRVAGDGPLRQELTDIITRHKLEDKVKLLGAQPQSEVIKHLESWADVFVLPCVIAKDGDRDGIPVSIAEAMAMGLPIISTDIVGVGELVQPGTGILTPPHDSSAVADALKTINAESQENRINLGKQGRKVVEREFNLVKDTTELAELFQKMITSA